ncbi:acyl carrier protein [candidate division WWE3 bacterium CG08_land_8_20_14_0_20_40_13]|uniref:Acyl carrier protein n=1 Tax=candidate division WWE3 bacterium CG08_land_8_20_14_0_20_40_13 TaxID=1975084 RepID=A0A2H0XG01_UNCKA|nr:MAG: acyl carrier protein [candidate division WWE3 bacterium CG08_land_8_20_14_0_20_40_13]
MNKEILPKLYGIISSQTGIYIGDISPDNDFEDDLNISDLELAEIISLAEDTFEIEIDTEDAKKIRTVADLAILIEEAGFI